MKIDTFFILDRVVYYKLATNQSPTSLVLEAFDPRYRTNPFVWT